MTALVSASRSWNWLRGTATLLCLAALACSQDIASSTTPSYGFIRVTVSTTGGDRDRDGYAVTIDGASSVHLKDVMGEQSFSATQGTHTLELRDVAPNCTVTGPNPQQVTVVPGQVISLSIEIVCVATGIAVTVRTEGPDRPATVRIAVDELAPVAMSANGVQTIGYLTPGSHTVTLLKPTHCTVAGGDQIAVGVVAAAISDVAFSVTCVPVTRRERIAYESAGQGADPVVWIELVDIDGSGAERLEAGQAPAWSPDGRELWYSDTRCYPSFSYYDSGYCTGGLILQDPELGDVRRPTSGEFGFDPAWSPARNEIAFDRFSVRIGESLLSLLDLATSVVTPVSIYGPESTSGASWSPDGERVAFVCTWPGRTIDLCIANRDGTGFVRLTNDEVREGRPAWSPDGASLAFGRSSSSGAASAVIVLLDLRSRTVTPLGDGSQPAWSPDGSRLVFASVDGLFVMNADGSDRKRLTTGRHYAPAWRPR